MQGTASGLEGIDVRPDSRSLSGVRVRTIEKGEDGGVNVSDGDKQSVDCDAVSLRARRSEEGIRVDRRLTDGRSRRELRDGVAARNRYRAPVSLR